MVRALITIPIVQYHEVNGPFYLLTYLHICLITTASSAWSETSATAVADIVLCVCV